MRRARRAAAGLLAGALASAAGCASWTSDPAYGARRATERIRSDAPADMARHLRPGDVVRLITVQERRYELTVQRVEADAFYSAPLHGRRYKVPYAQIKAIGIRREKPAAQAATERFLVVLWESALVGWWADGIAQSWMTFGD